MESCSLEPKQGHSVMTVDQAKQAVDEGFFVEDRYDEDFRTGRIEEVVNSTYCIVGWDDGTLEINEIRTLHFS
jgi:hypothetical protein